MVRWRTSNVAAEFRNPGRRSVALLTRVIVVRPPERKQVPAEVQFEVARDAVTDVADLGTARLCTVGWPVLDVFSRAGLLILFPWETRPVGSMARWRSLCGCLLGWRTL